MTEQPKLLPVTQEDRDAAARLWMEMTGDWPKDLCEEDALTLDAFANAFARHSTRRDERVDALAEELAQQADGTATIIGLLKGQNSPVAASLRGMLQIQEQAARAALQLIGKE